MRDAFPSMPALALFFSCLTLCVPDRLGFGPSLAAAQGRWAVNSAASAGVSAQRCVGALGLLPTAPRGLRSQASSSALQPLERRLRVGTIGLLRAVRRQVRRFFRVLSWTARQWVRWLRAALFFALVAMVASVWDRALPRTWRTQGFRPFCAALMLALAVCVRLLIDPRAPAIGKWLLLLAITYGVVPGDVLPDRSAPLGLIDDIVFVAMASRCFTRLCPDALVEAHARRAARKRERSRRRRARLVEPRAADAVEPDASAARGSLDDLRPGG